MSRVPRRVVINQRVAPVDSNRPIFRYLEFWKFKDLVERSAIFFPRIDQFNDMDPCEGRLPRDVWSLTHSEIKKWYGACKDRIFVSCWNLDEEESGIMWNTYAKDGGVRIRSTVGALADELSSPPPAEPEPYPPDVVAWAAATESILCEVNDGDTDGFTMGAVEYVDLNTVDVHRLLADGLSSVVPVFRKGCGFICEHEFRVILRPASTSGERARAAGRAHVHVEAEPAHFIHEIMCAPACDAGFVNSIRQLLSVHRLDIPVVASSLAI